MAVISAALVVMAFSVLGSRDEASVCILIVSIITAVAGVAFATVWLSTWPSRHQSLTMGTIGAVLLAVGSVMTVDPVIGLLGCTGIVITGGYFAFFHDTKAIAFNVLVATIAAAMCAIRVWETNQVAALAGFWLIIELNVAVPLGIQAVVRTMGADVVRSDHDALTGVLNRRAFYERASALLRVPTPDTTLIVVMIDLDRFKRLNDTYGHIAGDQALTAVGWALRQSSSNSAIIGRAGGEEFLVIDTLPPDSAEALPAKLCAVIAALPQPVTASVGAAVVAWGAVPDSAQAVENLIREADTAMYDAKRSGGNQHLIRRPAQFRS